MRVCSFLRDCRMFPHQQLPNQIIKPRSILHVAWDMWKLSKFSAGTSTARESVRRMAAIGQASGALCGLCHPSLNFGLCSD